MPPTTSAASALRRSIDSGAFTAFIVSAEDVTALRAAGYDDGAIVEVIAHVALNLYTNYVNLALDVPVDFPAVALRNAA